MVTRRSVCSSLLFAMVAGSSAAHATTRLYALTFEVGNPVNVAAASDLNGNGVPDFLVASQSANGIGQLSAVEGAHGRVIWSVPQLQNYGRMGEGLANIGDINGDGVSDVAVGTPRQQVGSAAFSGRVDVLSGSSGALLFRFDGYQPRGFFGSTVTGLGDVNADLVPDILACAPAEPEVLNPVTTSYCDAYSGLDGSLLYRISGGTLRAGLGTALTQIGDVTGDGVADFAASKVYSSATAVADGAVEIRNGADGSLIDRRLGAAGQRLGTLVTRLGDTNGDGLQEIAVTSKTSSGFGPTEVFSLNPSALPASSMIVLRFTLPQFERVMSIAAMADVNGDGKRDIAVGYPSSYTGNTNSGRVRIFSGANGGIVGELQNGGRVDQFGLRMAEIGDVTLDGNSEVVVAGSATSYGTAVFSSTNITRVGFGCGYNPQNTIEVLGNVTLGSTLTFRGTIPAAANGTAILTLGLKNWIFSGFDFDATPSQCRSGVDPDSTGVNYVPVNAAGQFTLNFTIPNNPSFVGIEIYAEGWATNQAMTEIYSTGGLVARVQ